MYLNEVVIQFTLFNLICCVSGASTEIKAKEESQESCFARVSTCESNDGNKRPVCGTNGRTYANKCRVIRAQCGGEPVAVAHRGPCIEGQSCIHALRYALRSQGGRRAAFKPRCRADGTYAAMQCAAASAASGCWCVTPDGKPLPDTAVRNGRPDCTRTGKSHTRRRSSSRGQRNKKSCTRADRSQFNANLIKIFTGEHERARTGAPGAAAAEPRAIADWKFRELDRDRSGALQKSEYRGLRRLIKKVVKPKRCARAWARGCDGDGDGAIARAEWAACLLATPDPPAPDYEEAAPEPEPDYEEEAPLNPAAVLPGTLMRQSFATEGGEAGEGNEGGEGARGRDDDANDCLTDRQAVLDEQKGGGAALYVPECTGDGRYARAQCYRSTPYCWCVHQDTGKPIPGSSVKDSRPDCDAAPRHASPMRGCPEPLKTNFLRDLMKLFVSKMAAATNGTVPGSSEMVKWGGSHEEQAATWIFVMLDKDKNKLLERREWRSFHQLTGALEPLRRCGKKLPRYCDVNHDSKISITEWLACLNLNVAQTPQAQPQGRSTETTKSPSSSRRKGPNPLESFLKADD